MGCGCNSNKSKSGGSAARTTAAAAVLLEVVDERGKVVYRTRDKRIAKQRADAKPGNTYRLAGTTTPITD